jgi:(1->4)-alpha-D-glucan 1-alpha-D-glucosylmutase
VPDLYQGTEAGDFSMVDPDNRRPVDFALLERMLDQPTAPDNTSFIARKFAVVRELLALRKSHRELFTYGLYVPIPVTGKRRGHVIAFERRNESASLLVVAQLRCASALSSGSLTASETWWEDTALDNDCPVGPLLSQSPFYVMVSEGRL